MPLTLEQYATEHLTRLGLPWPGPPAPEPVKAKPSLSRLPVRLVFWNVYGTLLNVPGGELWFDDPRDGVFNAMLPALGKTLQAFKMWQSMSRKPGDPAEQLREMYLRTLTQVKMAGSGGEKFPEVSAERIWDEIVNKLFKKDYQIDAATYGSQPEFVRKLAYFFHASLQGCGAYPGAADAVRAVDAAGLAQGLLADGQTFTPAQVVKAMRADDPSFEVGRYFPASLVVLSAERKARKPSDTLFKAAVEAAAGRGVRPADVLHVGSSIPRDIVPAKKFGFKTALFAGDRHSLTATADQLKDPASRPDVLLTALPQIADVVG
jgi:FMN phosphatase YigB (HAD superfamily)